MNSQLLHAARAGPEHPPQVHVHRAVAVARDVELCRIGWIGLVGWLVGLGGFRLIRCAHEDGAHTKMQADAKDSPKNENSTG